jgi:hypothetical protein
MAAELHLAENALALHLLLERLESLIDVIIADENLHAPSSFINRIGIWEGGGRQRAVSLTSRAWLYQIGWGMSTTPKRAVGGI